MKKMVLVAALAAAGLVGGCKDDKKQTGSPQPAPAASPSNTGGNTPPATQSIGGMGSSGSSMGTSGAATRPNTLPPLLPTTTPPHGGSTTRPSGTSGIGLPPMTGTPTTRPSTLEFNK